MIKASYKKYTLNFKNPSGTSRGILRTKETLFIILKKDDKMRQLLEQLAKILCTEKK